MTKEQAKLNALCNACAERAWRLAWHTLRDAHEAFDAVQQAFVVAARHPERLPPGDPWPWFAVVVVNEARNLRRKKRPQPQERPPELGRAAQPESVLEQQESHEALQRALDELPLAEREAIVLTQISGLTHARAAEALGIPEKTLSAQVARGKEKLRRRLQRDDQSISSYLALLPAGVPLQGWENALALWKSAASAAAVPAAGAALGGAIVAKKLMAAAGLAVALGVGFAGGVAVNGHWASPAPGERAARDGAACSPASPGVLRPAGARQDEAPVQDAALRAAEKERDEARAEAANLKQRAGTLEAERDRLKREAEKAQAELAPYKEAEALRGPTFTFGEAGQLDAIREADWKEMAEADAEVQRCLVTIREYQLKGERAPDEVYFKLQENTERVRKYEYRTIRRLPTAAQHNGELTHPISSTNLLATTLKLAGQPLDERQVAEINRLGEEFDARFKQLRESYGANTLRSQKITDEFLLKGAFRDSMLGVLNAAQYAVAVEPKVFKIAGLDLHCATLMLIHTSPVISANSADELCGKLSEVLAKRYTLTEAQTGQLGPALDGWLAAVGGILAPVPAHSLRNYTFEQAAAACKATVALQTEMLALLAPGEAQRSKIMEDVAIFVPRVIKAD